MILALTLTLLCSAAQGGIIAFPGSVTSSAARIFVDLHAAAGHDAARHGWLLQHLPGALSELLVERKESIHIFMYIGQHSGSCMARIGRLRRVNASSVAASEFDSDPCWSAAGSWSIALNHSPAVIELGGLPASAEIALTLRADSGDERWILFRTFSAAPARGRAPSRKILSVSCDRFLEDGDNEMVDVLNRREWDRDLSVHLGDQIYADGLVAAWKGVLAVYGGVEALFAEISRDEVEAALRAAFRSLYRHNWRRPSLGDFLRIGGHVMLPDDHEIVNNFDEDTGDVPMWRPFLAAGRQAFVEFQQQFSAPPSPASATGHPGAEPFSFRVLPPVDASLIPSAHSFHVVDRTGVLLLDSRYARAFGARGALNSFLGDAQWQDAVRQLSQWEQDPAIDDVALFTATPLMALSSSKARIVDAAEQERYLTHPRHAASLTRLVDLLAGARKLRVLVGGDVHIASHIDYCRDSDSRCLPQMVTSGLTIKSTALQEKKLYVFDWIASFLTRAQFQAPGGPRWNMYLRSISLTRNYGVVWTAAAPHLARRSVGPTWEANRMLWPAGLLWEAETMRTRGGLAWRSVTLPARGLVDAALHHGFRASRVLLRVLAASASAWAIARVAGLLLRAWRPRVQSRGSACPTKE